MSAPFTDLIITTLGNAMTATAWAGGGVITITSVQFGSGFPGVSDNIPGYTTLKTPICNGQITGENVLIAGQCTIRVNLAGTAIPSTFQINEIGVFASIGGGGAKLVAYMSTGAATGDTLTFGSPVVKDYAILVTFSQGVITTVNISLLQTVGLHAPSHLDNGIDPIPPPSTARSGLLLANPNDGTRFLSGTNPPSWAHVISAIISNTTLFVSTTGNDSTALPNDITHPWLTTQGALNYLNNFFIYQNATVTIQHAPGTYVIISTIQINHVNANRITIAGNVITSTTGTGTGTVSGSTGNWSIPITGVVNTAGMTAGGYVLVNNAGALVNYANNLICGFFKVSSVSGSTVTINVPFHGSTFPSLSGIGGITMTAMTTIITTSVLNLVGVNVAQFGVGVISNIGFVYTGAAPTASSAGLSFSGGTSSLVVVGVNGWNTASIVGFALSGIVCSSGSVVTCSSTCVTNCFIGFLAVQESLINIVSFCAATHGAQYGMWIDGSKAQAGGTFFISGTGNTGLLLLDSTFQLLSGTIYESYCLAPGVSVTIGSRLIINTGSLSTSFNTTRDVIMSSGSFINNVSAISGSNNFGFTIGVVTADLCLAQ